MRPQNLSDELLCGKYRGSCEHPWAYLDSGQEVKGIFALLPNTIRFFFSHCTIPSLGTLITKMLVITR
jgi:hypothetical protein